MSLFCIGIPHDFPLEDCLLIVVLSLLTIRKAAREGLGWGGDLKGVGGGKEAVRGAGRGTFRINLSPVLSPLLSY